MVEQTERDGVYGEGYVAFGGGAHRSANPYLSDARGQLWETGWLDASLDYRADNESDA
jgi:hypothetical protein